jgi:hypothetical protein
MGPRGVHAYHRAVPLRPMNLTPGRRLGQPFAGSEDDGWIMAAVWARLTWSDESTSERDICTNSMCRQTDVTESPWLGYCYLYEYGEQVRSTKYEACYGVLTTSSTNILPVPYSQQCHNSWARTEQPA